METRMQHLSHVTAPKGRGRKPVDRRCVINGVLPVSMQFLIWPLAPRAAGDCSVE
ncbi:MAG: hypothetical protein SGJ20_12975 [Planctomycetota bacterium]|nr:hypothetical protein [Planctomycetota bacterium]